MTEFSSFANQWHQPDGPLWTLHELHRLRCEFISQHPPLKDLRCVDLACGAGLMTEWMCQQQARSVNGYDMSPELLAEAKARAHNQDLPIHYHQADLRQPLTGPIQDVICAFEIIEHLSGQIDNCIQTFLHLSGPHTRLYISSLNKTLLGRLVGIHLTEDILRWLPAGTHQYEDFCALDTLIDKLSADWVLTDLVGMSYSFQQQKFVPSTHTDIHYLCCFTRSL